MENTVCSRDLGEGGAGKEGVFWTCLVCDSIKYSGRGGKQTVGYTSLELSEEVWDGNSNPVQQAFLKLCDGEAPRCNLICSRSPVDKLEFKLCKAPHCTSLEDQNSS